MSPLRIYPQTVREKLKAIHHKSIQTVLVEWALIMYHLKQTWLTLEWKSMDSICIITMILPLLSHKMELWRWLGGARCCILLTAQYYNSGKWRVVPRMCGQGNTRHRSACSPHPTWLAAFPGPTLGSSSPEGNWRGNIVQCWPQEVPGLFQGRSSLHSGERLGEGQRRPLLPLWPRWCVFLRAKV